MPDRVYATPLLDKLGSGPAARVAIVGAVDPAVIEQYSDTHTALRLVIPKRLRVDG